MSFPRLLIVCAALFAAGPARAADMPKPNTLTPKEIADGWLLLFDGETTFGWETKGKVTVKNGELIVEGLHQNPAATFKHLPSAFEMLLDVNGETVIATGPTSVGRTARDWTTYRIRFTRTADRVTSVWSEVTNGGDKQIVSSDGNSTPPQEPPPPMMVHIIATGKLAKLRNIKLRPLGAKPLFNGKDLSGWKVFAGNPKQAVTKFTVTPAGELSAKNGPGDLQTEKPFDNFVLQLECKTNGKWLNSGVFFRCLPDLYQQGYEAQIQNAYRDDRTKPVDFGTGAIYRRVPARRVVSNDNEWFTLTLVADGPHISTWVNGYQTVDWTDDRKASDNARQGLKTGKGHLSIQGHDPTTDLLFRNIRLAELPGK